MILANLRAGLIVASVIPLSMLFAVILLTALERKSNEFGAIDFWNYCRCAVIIVETTMHHLQNSKEKKIYQSEKG
jgi:cobalt-zinc-cadmium resistance protein CzcA